MIPTHVLANLLPWSLQVAAIVAIASLLPWLVRLDAAGVRYVYWRAVAVLCLTLPWIQPYRNLPVSARAAVSTDSTRATAAVGVVAQTVPQTNWESLLVWVLLIGIVVRFAWLAIGLVRLRTIRRNAARDSVAALDGDLQNILGTQSAIRYVRDIEQPITFGLIRPIVLLPETLCDQPREIQQAVLGHELLHVKRHDWAWLIVEEIAVCLFWFHPASWWVTSQIQHAREEIVDELAIQLTGRRKAYVEALLTFSDATSVLPTAAFARRRHLFRRIALVSKESVMSSRRIVATCAAMALVVGTGSWYAVSAFPLRIADQPAQAGPGPLELRAHAVTPENPIPRRIHYQEPILPDWVGSERAVVEVKVTLDDVGRVAEARTTEVYRPTTHTVDADRVRQTKNALTEAALASVRQWRYDPPFEAPLAFTVEVRLGKDAQVMAFQPKSQVAFQQKSDDDALRVGGDIKAPKKIKDVRAVYPPIAREAGVSGVVIIETTIGADGFIQDAHVLKSIPLLDEDALDAVKQWQFEPTLVNGRPVPVIMTTTVNFFLQ
jgi:TonB family protein